MPEDYLGKVFTAVDRKRSGYVNLLKEATTVGSDKVIDWVETSLRKLGATTTQHHIDDVKVKGKLLKQLPALVANLKSEAAKVTLFVYSHVDSTFGPERKCFDNENSAALTQEDGVLFGSGVTDSKGPLLCWFNAVQAYQELKLDLPVNIRFFIEAIKGNQSFDLIKDFLHTQRASLFKNVICICISDSSRLSTPKPAITYGLRGLCEFVVTVQGPNCNLHSGVHGGMVAEPMTDIVHLMSSLVNTEGEILVPDIRTGVLEVTPQEEKAYHSLNFDVEAFKKSIGVESLLHKDAKKRLLMHRSRFPSLSIHGIRSETEAGEGEISGKVSATFSVRIVPNQTPQETFHRVQLYLMYVFSQMNSSNRISVEMPVGVSPWLSDTNGLSYKSAAKAIKRVYEQEPELVRGGASIPLVRDLQDISNKTVLLLPVGCGDHSLSKDRERIDVNIFMDGTKVVASFLHELSLQRPSI